MRLAQRVAQAGPTPEARALAAALLASQQRQRQQDEDAAWTLGACAAATGDVWCLLQLALLCAHQAEAAATPRARHQRHRASLAFLRLAGAAVHAAAKDWDCWLRCGASAALGSFVALCSSSAGGPAEAAAQLAEVSLQRVQWFGSLFGYGWCAAAVGRAAASCANTPTRTGIPTASSCIPWRAPQVSRLVTAAAAEEGGAELWALQARRGGRTGGWPAAASAAHTRSLRCTVPPSAARWC